MLFLWAPPLPRHPNYIEPSQLKEAIDLLPVLAPVPSPGDHHYAALDTMCQAIADHAEDAGYSICAEDSKLFINRGNQVTSPYKHFCRVFLETISLQFLLNSRGDFTMIKALDNQSPEITRDLQVIQGCLIAYICNHVPDLAEDMFQDVRHPPPNLNLDANQMCRRRLQMNRKCAKGVYTGWPHPDGGVWIMHWFLWTFLCGEHRKTFEKYPTRKSLFKNLGNGEPPIFPRVLTPKPNLQMKDFIKHVSENNPTATIPHPKRHNVLQWKGEPIIYTDDEDCIGCFSETFC